MIKELNWVLNYVPTEHKERILNCDPNIQKAVLNKLGTHIREFRKELSKICSEVLEELDVGNAPQEGKFLKIKRFIQLYPSFTEGFFRFHCTKNSDFIKRVVRRVNTSVYISVDDFWKWMDDQHQSEPNTGVE